VLEQVPQLAAHRTLAELSRAYARRGDFVLNLERGVERDRRARARGRGSERPGEIAASAALLSFYQFMSWAVMRVGE